MTPEDHALLRRAITLATTAIESGNPPFGSLLAGPDGTVLAEDHNTTVTDRDVTAHPELKLARWAARELDADTASRVTMYTSCEPCGMCAAVIRLAGLRRVLFALPGDKLTELRPNPVRANVPVEGPALLDEVRAAMEPYYR